jgi:hypothetical protein
MVLHERRLLHTRRYRNQLALEHAHTLSCFIGTGREVRDSVRRGRDVWVARGFSDVLEDITASK